MNYPTFSSFLYSDTFKDITTRDGDPIGLRRQSVDVFKHLAEHHDQVLTREEIQTKVWKHQAVTDDSLSHCISDIRKAIGDTDRRILKTVPRQGYMLVADNPSTPNHKLSATRKKQPWCSRKLPYVVASLLAITLAVTAPMPYTSDSTKPDIKPPSLQTVENSQLLDPPTILIRTTTPARKLVTATANSTRVALSRYKSVSVTNDDNATYSIQLSASDPEAKQAVSVELISNENNTLLFAETLISQEDSNTVNLSEEDLAETFGTRIAGMIASPGGGAVSRNLRKTARNKTADELSRSQCYAFGYGCTNCSGELDSITSLAEECLANILDSDPTEARAWGLQSTLYARQYLWSSTLSEPQRSNQKDRSHIKTLAIEAANKAEKYSDGTDTSVYWGMAQAYGASCQIDKLRTVVDRGLLINPNDPSLLGAFGSWIAYSGDWDAGVNMINKALSIEPRHYKRWWLFAVAKRHYAQGDYEQALKVFRKAYNERNWLSHLQLAYTLPHLGRIDEAIEERRALERLYPSITIENVLQFYKSYCFEDVFLEKVKWALTEAGLPSRGSIDDYSNILPTEAKVVAVNGFTSEYKDVGTGTPIVFVHGSISDYRAWSHYQNPVSETHRYISYSLRYAGSQKWPDENGASYGIATDADDLIAFIEALGIGPVYTVSWSRGGRVSGLAALDRPDLFLGNIHYEPIVTALANTNDLEILSVRDTFNKRFDESNKAFEVGNIEEGAAIVLENVFELPRGHFDFEIMPLRAMNRDAAKNMALQVSIDDVAELNCERLQETLVPTLVILGGNTNTWWQHLIHRYHECIPDSRLVVIADVNHNGPIRRPEKISALILSFIESQTTTPNISATSSPVVETNK